MSKMPLQWLLFGGTPEGENKLFQKTQTNFFLKATVQNNFYS
jgi:hypothetical protein